MDQNMPPHVPVNLQAAQPATSFAPIKKLLTVSWDRVQKHLLQLFLLTVMMFALWIVAAIIVGIILFAAGAFSVGSSTTVLGILGLILLPIVVIFAVITMLGLQISTIWLLAETQPALSLIQLYKMSLKKVWALLLVSLITMILVVGGLVVFIIPGILFGILLSLSSYYVLLDNQHPLEAIRRSVFVVSKHFGVIFIRLAALMGISIVAGFLFNLLSSVASNLSLLVSLGSLVFNLLYGWVSTAYVMFTFQEMKRASGEGKGKMLWMVLIALIGWIIIGVAGFFVFRAAGTTTTPVPLNTTPITLPVLSPSPRASVAPAVTASPSASVRATATPRPTATPRASAATSSANR